jgi:hypothetical protein
MPRVDILYHIPNRLTARQCAKLEHILRHQRGVMSARFCPHSAHAINVEYDLDSTDAKALLSRIRTVDHQATMFGL